MPKLDLSKIKKKKSIMTSVSPNMEKIGAMMTMKGPKK